MLNNYDWDWRAGVAPIEIVYTLVVQDGLIVRGDGSVDPASEQRRAASLARLAAAAAPAAPVPTAAPAAPDTQGRGTRSIGPWIVAAALALVSTVVLAGIQRPPTARRPHAD
jgi:hypothetical protein